MMQLSLNGDDWHFKDYYGEDWRWRNPHQPDSRDTLFWRRGTVPGSVHHDLWMAGEIPNPYFERNSLLLEWIPARTWVYKKTFFVEDSLRGKRLHLHFEGVDYEAHFFLNGEYLGHHRSMYTPVEFEVTEHIRFGTENLLAVVIEPAPHEQPQVSRTALVRTHKSRMTYWWDFCPRMIHLGIWDSVYLDVTDGARIKDVSVRPQLSDDFSRADISIEVEPQPVEVEVTLRFEGKIIAQATGQKNLSIEQPHLWWPNGHGEQPLYEAEVRVPGDSRTVRFGIRKIDLIQNENSSSDSRPYTFVVNDKKIFIKGWNWVPLDVMYGVERPEKLSHLFTLAKHAHVNLLRVWGGGLIEKEAFYNLADELGIMVWQEFIQSSSGIENIPSDSPEFIQMMVTEVEQIIPRKRNHPSLVLWCGGNELMGAGDKPLDDSHSLLAALKDTVTRLDSDRFWLPTSPTGRVFGNSLENIARDPQGLHDVHGPWEYQGVTGQYELYNRSTSLLHSEFGVEGITNLKTLNATIVPEHQIPVSLSNPYWHHLGAWWVKQPVWQMVFGEISDVATLTRATQFMQAEGLRYAVEADRRRKYQNSGTLPWQFNEPYPMAACTSAVDYYGQAKPVYYTVAQAYEPVHVSAKYPTAAWEGRSHFEVDIWINNSLDAFDALLQIKIVGLNGHVYRTWEEKPSVQANSAAQVAGVKWVLDELVAMQTRGLSPLPQLESPLPQLEPPLSRAETIFFLDLLLQEQNGHPLSHNRTVFTSAANFAPLLAVPPTRLTIEKEESGDDWLLNITNTGDTTALFIWLEDSRAPGATGYVYFDRNHFCLFPHEVTQVSVTWRDVPPLERSLNIRGWNTL